MFAMRGEQARKLPQSLPCIMAHNSWGSLHMHTGNTAQHWCIHPRGLPT